MQMRENAATTEFEGILEEEVREELREAATVSMGTEISADDISNITALCDQVRPLCAPSFSMWIHSQMSMLSAFAGPAEYQKVTSGDG